MKELTTAQARRLALEDGAELEIEGRRFNTARTEVAQEPAPPPPAPEPAPQPAPVPPVEAPEPQETLTRAEVEAMLKSQSDDFRQHIDAVTRAFAAALGAMTKTEPGQPKKLRHPWKFDVQKDRHGEIVAITAIPIEE